MIRVRHIAVALDSSIAALAEFESVVHIFDLRLRRKLASFKSTLDFGGTRLAVTNDGKCCIAGAYHRHGIAAYRTLDGEELWRRKDLKKVQRIHVAPNGESIFACFDRTACHQLSVEDGATVQTIRGVRDAWQSCLNDYSVWEKRDRLVVNHGSNLLARIQRETFGVLDVAFGLETFCFSEVGADVRCIEHRSSNERWRYAPRKGSHVLSLAYNPASKRYFAVEWPYQRGGAYSLIGVDEDSGKKFAVARIHAYEHAFFSSGTCLMLADGRVLSTSSGNTEFSLNLS